MITALATSTGTELATGYQADNSIESPRSAHPVTVYLASLKSRHSRRAMEQSLRAVAHLLQADSDVSAFPWHLLRYQHTQAIRAKLADSCTAATGNRHLSALRGVLKECWRLGRMSAEDYHRAIDIKRIAGENTVTQAERGRHLKASELAALMAACDDATPAGARDAAVIALAYTAGLRRAELAGLHLADYNADDKTLTVKGKGSKTRVIPLADNAVEILTDWLAVRGLSQGALFLRIRKGGAIVEGGMSEQAVYYILLDRAEQAKVKAFGPHDLRRTFAGDLLDAGADIATVQKLMGHADVKTTARYDRRDAKAKRIAVNKLHIPYDAKK